MVAVGILLLVFAAVFVIDSFLRFLRPDFVPDTNAIRWLERIVGSALAVAAVVIIAT